MSKEEKRKMKLYSGKYFKWGLTGFLVALSSSVAIYLIFHFKDFTGGISYALGVFTPIIYGLVIAYLLNPIMRFFEVKCIGRYYEKHGIVATKSDKKRIRTISVIATIIIVSLLIYAFFNSVLPQLISSIETLINNFPTYYKNIIGYGNSLAEKYKLLDNPDLIALYDKYSLDIEEFIKDNIFPNVKTTVRSLSTGVKTAVSAVLNLLLGIIFAVYLLSSKEKYIGMVKKIMYSLMPKERVNDLMTDLRFIDKTFGGFLIGKIVDSIIIGILCFIGLSIFKVPFAVLVSVIVGVTNIIPFFGPYLGAVPSAFIILLIDPKKCLTFLIFVLVLQQIDGNVIGPTILGSSIGVSSFWIVVSITVFGRFFGVGGMLIGVPCFACAYAFIRRRVNNRLAKKGMSIATLSYAQAAYMDEENKLIPLSVSKQSGQQYSRYIELNPSMNGIEEGKRSLILRIGDGCLHIINKLKEKIVSIKGRL
ncbi:MAG: AI-2E family transporter [Lachnospiraceae bacterium]|nr:AI-2E family transporter [Lachnospiraceae bacterium]